MTACRIEVITRRRGNYECWQDRWCRTHEQYDCKGKAETEEHDALRYRHSNDHDLQYTQHQDEEE